MKKTLSLLLVLAMVLSSFGFAFAAEDEVNPAEFLNEKGILKGNASGDLMLEENLKRQDMVVMLSRLLGEEDEAKAFEGETSFTDIADKFYVPYIAWAEAKELTEGVGDNKFGFDRAVKENEVVAFMLRALGYTDVKWEDVPAKAVELGLVAKDADLDKDAKRSVLAELTYKALGMKMKDSDKTLAEHLEIEMPVPEVLEVEEVVADNLKEIKVVFNKAVDEESATNADNYVTNAPAIKNITYDEDANTAILLLGKAMEPKEEYKITVKGVKDDKDTLNVAKTFVAIDNAIPEVVDVVGLGTKAVKVIVSEPVENASSLNFKLGGKTLYANVSTEGREVFIRPYSSLTAGEHELTVSGLKDFAGFKSLENKYTFEVVEDKEAPTVVEAVGTTNKVVVTFSEDVDNATVNNKTIYWKSGSNKKYPNDNVRLAGNKYAFYFGKDEGLPVHETTLFVQDVADYSGNTMAAAEIAIKAEVDLTRPEVLSVKLGDDKKTITVKFNKPVLEEDAIKKANYRVLDSKDNKQIINKIEPVDSKTYKVILLSALKADTTYTLKISDIRDTNRYANVMAEYSEDLVVADYVQPKFENAYIKAQNDDKEGNKVTKIVVYFNKSMDLATLVNPNNYLVKLNNSTRVLADVDNEIDINSDGSIVTIYVTDEDYHVTQVGVLGVKDKAGNLLSNYGEMQGHTDTAFNLVLDGEGIAVDSKDTIELEFSLPIKAAPEKAFTLKGADIESIDIEENVVTLTVDELKADASNTFTINEKLIEAFNGEKLGTESEKTIKLIDEIRPSIEKVTGKVEKGNLVLNAVFDEKLDEVNAADLIVRRLDTKVTVPAANVALDVTDASIVVITIPVSAVNADTAYQVEVYGARSTNANYTKDVLGNVAKDSKAETDGAVEGVVAAIVDGAKEAVEGEFDSKSVAQADVNTAEAAKAKVEAIIAGLELDGVTATVNPIAETPFKAAVAHTADSDAGGRWFLQIYSKTFKR